MNMTDSMKTAIQLHSDENLRQLDELIDGMDRKSIVKKLRRMYASRGISEIMSVIQDGLRSVQLDESENPVRMPNSFSKGVKHTGEKKKKRIVPTVIERYRTPPSSPGTDYSQNSTERTPAQLHKPQLDTQEGKNLIDKLNQESDRNVNTKRRNSIQNPNKRKTPDDRSVKPDQTRDDEAGEPGIKRAKV